MTQELLNKMGQYYVDSGVNLCELSKLFSVDLFKLIEYFTEKERLRLNSNLQKQVNAKKSLEDNHLNTLLKLALKFRLSLKSVYKMDKLQVDNPTSEDILDLWNRIYAYLDEKELSFKTFKYLFNYETVNNSQKEEFSSLTGARIYYKKIMQEKDEKKKQKLLDELSKEERDYNNLKKYYQKGNPISIGDIYIIARYRVKFAITQETVSKDLKVTRFQVQYWESKITEEKLINRLDKLNNYNQDLYDNYKRRK